jgi:signal transduction histidine kinase
MRQTSRAAEITRQLLAFSRRQVLQPRVVNLNDCVRQALSMIARTVGVDVSIELKLDETTDHVFIDPEQLTLVIMHLADNARQAMSQGGVLPTRLRRAAKRYPTVRPRPAASRYPTSRLRRAA